MITKEDLNQLEERLTKLIEEKLKPKEEMSELMHLYYKDINDKLKNLVHSPNKGFMAGAEIKPKPIWETHPDWDRCKKVRDRFKISKDTITVNVLGNCGRLLPFSEAHAKRQVAEIKLMEIAEKWNEGANIHYSYTVALSFNSDASNHNLYIVQTNSFYQYLIRFNSKELAEKSIELHKELWNDYFLINNQNK